LEQGLNNNSSIEESKASSETLEKVNETRTEHSLIYPDAEKRTIHTSSISIELERDIALVELNISLEIMQISIQQERQKNTIRFDQMARLITFKEELSCCFIVEKKNRKNIDRDDKSKIEH
jgi:hypothetical protein